MDAPLDLADRIEILADFGAISGAELALQASKVVVERVEQAGLFPERCAAISNAAPFAEEAFKNNPRMSLRGQWCRGRRPRKIVLINARIAVIALADHLHQIHRQLQGRQLRRLTDVLSGDLIDRGSEVIIRALRQLRLGRAEEGGIGRGVAAGISVLQLQIRNGRDVLLNWRKRAQDRRELVELVPRRSPACNVTPHWHKDEAEPTHRVGRRLRQNGRRGNHRIQQRKRQGGAHSAKKRPSRERFFR